MTLDGVLDQWDAIGVQRHSVYDTQSGIVVSAVVVPKASRGSGIGSKAMRLLVDYADKSGKRIMLTPSTDFGASSKDRLVQFYKRFGFVENKGRNRDYAISDTLYRDPQKRNPSERTFIPPPAVAAEARLGLAIRAQQPPSQRCCTPVGLRRASQLANRQPVSVRTLKRMRSYFQRHAVDAKGARWDDPYNPSKGKVAWLVWGGDSGRKWCNSILDRLGE